MSIDWFTFTAQIVNFLILVGLLRWFLYGPITRAMQQREERIAGRLAEADHERRKAEEKLQEYHQKLAEIDEQRNELFENARREVDEERQRMMKEAKEQLRQAREQWHKAFEGEREDLLSDFRRQVGEMATAAARRTLQQLADVTLEERMLGIFSSRLGELDEKQRKEIVGHLGNGKGNAILRSAFGVPGEWRKRFRDAIQDSLGQEVDVTFEETRELICGLELEVAGYSFGWNIDEFLQNLELEFGEQLRRHR